MDATRIAVRPVEFTEHQKRFANSVITGSKLMSDTPEEAIALMIYALSEFILRVAKPEYLAEAVETSIICLKINTGQSNAD